MISISESVDDIDQRDTDQSGYGQTDLDQIAARNLLFPHCLPQGSKRFISFAAHRRLPFRGRDFS